MRILCDKQEPLAQKDAELAIRSLLDIMSTSLSAGDRVETRGLGSFSLHYHPPRVGPNRGIGESVDIQGEYVPHFEPGKEPGEKLPR